MSSNYLISAPTRITDSSRTLIDLIVSSDKTLFSDPTVAPCSPSGYHIITCQIRIKPPKSSHRYISSIRLKQCNFDMLNNDLKNVSLKLNSSPLGISTVRLGAIR